MSDLKSLIHTPSLDHPFGIEVWPIFEKAWLQVRAFPPQNFRFVPGQTPMSTLKETATVLIAYYVIVLGGREVMRNREAWKFPTIWKLHNFILTAISAALLLLFVEQLLPTVVRKGVFYAICDADGGWTNRLVTLYYVSGLCIEDLASRLTKYSLTTSQNTLSFSIPSTLC